MWASVFYIRNIYISIPNIHSIYLLNNNCITIIFFFANKYYNTTFHNGNQIILINF